jgi:hypothetical protein
MVALGREFQFPFNFSSGKYAELYSTPGTVKSYSKQLASCLTCCRPVTKLWVKERCYWHRKLVSSQRRDPWIYAIGDVVFARRATISDSKRVQVNKLMHPFTGPWRIVKSLPGASYKLEFATDTAQKSKKHASDLSPYPLELTPFQPVDGTTIGTADCTRCLGHDPIRKSG